MAPAVGGRALSSCLLVAILLGCPVAVLADGPALAAPTDVRAEYDPGTDAVTLSWGQAADASKPTEYAIYRRKHRSIEDPIHIASVPGSERRYVDSALAPGIRYDYTVRAYDATTGTESPHSRPVVCMAAVDDVAPAAPTRVRAEASSSPDAVGIAVLFGLSADDTGGAEDVLSYAVYRSETEPSETPSSGALVGAVPAGSMGFADMQVEPGRSYWYWVTARDTANESPPSNVAGPATAAAVSASPLRGLTGALRTIVALVLTLGIAIAIHEVGHMAAAKTFRIRVDEFSIGFGAALWQRAWRRTLYSLRLVPLGGYVRVRGMVPDEVSDPEGIYARPVLARVGVMAAGAGMNLAFAFLVYAAVAALVAPGTRGEVADVLLDSPAEAAGLQAGDSLVAVNGRVYSSHDRAIAAIARSPGRPVELTIERAGQRVRLSVTPVAREVGGSEERALYGLGAAPKKGVIGAVIQPKLLPVSRNPVEMAAWGGRHVRDTVDQLLVLLGHLVTREAKVRDNVGGPIAIAQGVYEVQKLGAGAVIAFMAFINVCLAVFNLLPIPMLDGSRIVIMLVEGARQKLFNKEKEALFHFAGMVLLLALVAVISVFDVQRLLGLAAGG